MTQVTVRGFLFGEDERSQQAIDRTLRDRGVLGGLGGALGGLSGAGRAAVGHQVAAATNSLLQIDIADLLLGGWRAHTALQSAARATAANPGATQVVELTAHQISSVHEPYLDVVVGEQRLAQLRFQLRVDIEVHGLLATVWQGTLVGLQCGRCRVAVSLGCEGVELARREGEIDAPLAIRLREGIPLLRAPEPA